VFFDVNTTLEKMMPKNQSFVKAVNQQQNVTFAPL
jgi:hypothetical protein